MFAIGNDELNNNGDVGKTIVCPHCGKEHDIKYGDRVLEDGTKVPSKLLAFYNCGDELYLAGIDGKLVEPRKPERDYYIAYSFTAGDYGGLGKKIIRAPDEDSAKLKLACILSNENPRLGHIDIDNIYITTSDARL